MRYVILRDDDTNALTPPECLERLYRPFLYRGCPVNLATIPAVDVHARMSDGSPEGFLVYRNGAKEDRISIGSNSRLVSYLQGNAGYNVVQHGCHHEYLEFDCASRTEAAARIERGTRLMMEAGFSRPNTFVAPYDKLSRASLREVAARFRVLSTGWFELGRVPYPWWPKFAVKKFRDAEHWRAGGALLLSHPGCFLSCHRPSSQILDAVVRWVNSHPLTVLVTHWWEYFRGGQADQPLIEVLHETAEYLAGRDDVRMISFDQIAELPSGFIS